MSCTSTGLELGLGQEGGSNIVKKQLSFILEICEIRNEAKRSF